MSESIHVFRRETEIEAPLSEVFEFFSRPENLERITPGFLRFQILTAAPIIVSEGCSIQYRMRLFGVPFRWLTRIDVWDPPFQFTDVQLKGPYTLWRHTHKFRELGDRTAMTDEVEYAFWAWIFEPVIHRLFVARQIAAVFDFREKTIKAIFAGRV